MCVGEKTQKNNERKEIMQEMKAKFRQLTIILNGNECSVYVIAQYTLGRKRKYVMLIA